MLVGDRQPTGPAAVPQFGPVDGIDLPNLMDLAGPPRIVGWGTPRWGIPSHAAEGPLQGPHGRQTPIGPALAQNHTDQARPPTRVAAFQPAGRAEDPRVAVGSVTTTPLVIGRQARFAMIASPTPDLTNGVVGQSQLPGDLAEALPLSVTVQNGSTDGYSNSVGH